MARVALGESKIRARRRRRRMFIAVFCVLAFLVVFGAGAWASQAQVWRISRITVVGAQTVATSSISDIAQSVMRGEYLYVFPKDNVLIYPKEAISEALLKRIPALASVTIGADTFDTLRISVVERQPKALWCGVEPDDQKPCFLLDESGVAYSGDLNFEGDAYKHYFGDLSGTTTPKQYLSDAQFRSLSALVDTIGSSPLQGQKDAITSVWVDQNRDAHVSFASGFKIIFPLSADGGDVYQRLTLALQADPFKQHKISEFDYLDLRFGDKLYYKLK